MKKIHFIAVFLFSFTVTNLIAQSASVTWPLTNNQNPNTPIGNIQASPQSIGTPTSPYKLEMYPQEPYSNSNRGQQLWTGNQGTGWIAGLPDYTRYIQFDVNPSSGNDFTVQFISFDYSDFPTPNNSDFHILKSEVWYAIDNNWSSSVQLNSNPSNPLDYLSSVIQTFSKNVNVQVQDGQTFSVRIYPYAPNGAIAMTPSFATHRNVIIEGTTSPVVTTGSICGMKFNDLNGNGRKDQGEQGLSGWTINLSMGAVNMTATTGADGTYCFNDLPAGTYTLSETQILNGWQQTYPTNPSTHTVVLQAGQNILNVDFGNRQVGSICGMKFNDLDGDGEKDEGEPGISGWEIQLTNVTVVPPTTTTVTTDENGEYCFNNLAAGTYTLSETQQDSWQQTYPSNPYTYTVELSAGENILNVDFGNTQYGSVEGIKFNDLDGDGEKDEGEPGISGWIIALTLGATPGGDGVSIMTDENGVFHFVNVPPGVYTLQELQQNGWDQTYPDSSGTYILTITSGLNIIGKDFGNKQLFGSICGMKFNDLNGNGQNDNEPGLSGWIIELKFNGPNGEVTLRDTTDSNGGYCFNNLAFGDYTLNEVIKEGWTQKAPASGSYTVTINQEVNLIGYDFGNKEDLNPDCTDFENNSMNGWTANNISTSFQQNGTNHYIQTTDQAGVSTFYTTTRPYTGNWTSLFTDGCGSICFDITFIFGGHVFQGQTPPQTLTPYIALEGAGFKASFVVNQQISVGDGWHTFCAPLSFLNSDGTLPSNSDGYWMMTSGTPNDWNTLLTNVTKVRLLADPTSFQGEKIGYDNICLKNTGDCDPIVQLGSICGLKILDKDGDGERDSNEDIIPNWGITLSNGTTSTTVYTNANGEYCFDNLPAGTYTVSEEHRTGYKQIFPPDPGVHTFTLLPGENKTNINFSNIEDITVKLGSICGIKFNDINGDGDQDLPNEVGLAGWTFQLTGASNQSVVTDLNGNFCFTNLPAGTYTLKEVIQDGWEPTSPDTTGIINVTLAEGENRSEIFFGNKEKFGSICGMKYNDLNDDGDWDPGEPGLPGWQISISLWGYTASGHASGPTLNEIAIDTTDENGNYCFTNLRQGNYLIGEYQQDGWTQTEPATFAYSRTLTPGQIIDKLNFGNKVDITVRLGSICGIKFNDKDGDGEQDPGELGIPDWQIQIGGPVDMTVLTDKEGKFCFDNLPPGEYKVGEEFRSRWRQTKPSSIFYIIQLASGENKTDLIFGNTEDKDVQLGSICGTKFYDKNRDGRQVSGELGINGWTIYLEGPMNATAVTDANGNFCFYGLIPGTYTVREENRTGWRQTKPSSITYTLEVGNGDNFDGIDFGNFEDPSVTLGSICGIKFNDLNRDGEKQDNEPVIPNWTINLSGTMNLTTRTDARGKFCFENLTFGRYTLYESHRDGWIQTAPSTGSFTFELSEDNSKPDTFYFGNKYEEPNIGCVNPPSGMVLWLTGDNNTNDISGFNNHGTVMFDLGFAAGKVNQAFIVNNFGYITVEDNSSLNFGKENFSIDAWIKTTDNTNSFSIVNKTYVSSSFNITGYSLSLSQGKMRFIMGDGSTFIDKLVTTIQIGDGLWHHVAVTIDRKNVTGGKMYIDGNLVLTFDPTSVSNSITNNSKMEIFDVSNFYNHNGNQIDELEIFNRAITQAEIVSIFNAGSAGKCKTSVRLGSICGIKFNDKNDNGRKDADEDGIYNWQINLGGPTDLSISTDRYGNFCFDNLKPGVYTIKEEQKENWTQTYPSSPNSYTITLTAGQRIENIDFGNKYEPKPDCVNPPSGMKAWWSFDYSSRDARQDLAGFNNFGTMVNSPLQVAGKVAGALQFDGVDDYVEVADHFELNFGTKDFSFDAWIKTNDVQGVKIILDKRTEIYGQSLEFKGYSIFLYDGKLSLQLANGSLSNSYANYTATVLVADGNWHHIAITVSRTNTQGIIFYLDGVQIQISNPTGYQGSITNTSPLRIGRQSFTGIYSGISMFKGILDEIELFKRVLTPSEVLAIYNAGSAGKCKPNDQGGSVSGTVWHDTNHNGVMDPNEVGLAQRPVLLNGPTIAQTETDEDGYYVFTGCKPGDHTISVVKPNDWSCTYPLGGRFPFKLEEGQSLAAHNFGLADDPCPTGQKSWYPLGSGLGGEVAALAVMGTNLFAGGYFTHAGNNQLVNHIAKWNGSSWSPLVGSNGVKGVNGNVYALAVYQNKLYVGGHFTSAGGVSVNNIAVWDGTNWSALTGTNGINGVSGGANPNVLSIAVKSNEIFVGGSFLSAGGVNAYNIAKWNGTNWLAVGNAFDSGVNSLLEANNNIYAGGFFEYIGNVHVNKISKWDGISWSPLQSGVKDSWYASLNITWIRAQATDGTNIYAGGSFGMAGGLYAKNIAKWDGSSWSTLGIGSGGVNSTVFALTYVGGILYAGGEFTTTNPASSSISANRIAKWNGTNWSALGSGMSGNSGTSVRALAVIGGDLYAAGNFYIAGGVNANNIARYSCSGTVTSVGDDNIINTIPQQFQISQNYPNPFNPTTTIRYDLPKAGFVKIIIYDILGREVRVLVNEEKTPGVYEVKFDARNLASGVYFYTIRTPQHFQSKKMILLK